jgi:hypothetical protein
MTITLPTADDAQALHAFILQRADEEHAAIIEAIGNDTIHPDVATRFYRISNSNKLAITGTAAYVVDLLGRGENEQAALAWDHLTAAGEEWRDHPDYLPRWENAQRARIRQQLGV